jgi:hypothetical protein
MSAQLVYSPGMDGHTCKVVVIAGERSAQHVRSHIEERIDAVPRLTRRLDPAPGPAAWVADADFSLDRHVTSRGALDDAGLRELIGELMATPLDRERPLWTMDVVTLLPGERTALVWRLHHSIADGRAAMATAQVLLLDPSREEPPRRPPGPAPPTAASAPRKAADRRREVAFLDAPLEELRRIGRAGRERASVDDVALSAVGGGVRTWLEQLGAPAEGLRVKVPVSVHLASDDSFMLIDLPLEHDDPLARLAAVTRETSLGRYTRRWAMSPRVFTLNVSHVAGPADPQRVMGAPLLELHWLAEVAHRRALRVTIVSAAGRISFGLCADPDSIDGLGLIADGIAREIAALDRAAGGPRASGLVSSLGRG